MKTKFTNNLPRSHEQYLRIKFEHQLAEIRLYYTVFCLAILFVAQKHLEVSPLVLMLFVSAALTYSFVRLLRPVCILKEGWFPPAADWLDFLFVAVLIYMTGGVKGFFFIAYAMPICGVIMKFGLKAGIAGYVVALAFTGLMYYINTVNPSIPSAIPRSICLTAGMGTLAFVAWLVGILAEQEWKLRDEIYLSSITDHLSGLYNSSYLKARIEEEIARGQRDNQNFTLSFIDLDNFKSVNDQYGHLIGDKVLKQVANILAENIRKSDVLARYGGDEFVLLMPGMKIEQGKKVMKRIEDLVATSTFTKGIRIGISSGTVVFPGDGDSLDNLLTTADRRMYEKKGKKLVLNEER
ncbi:MAG: GGDEF domain-containing protein [Firmicutes bacterium]|nr:GGDEF domain-containing protein [Bacillota bacterium]